MLDKDYYDDNLKTDALILRNLQDEAQVAITEIKSITKYLKKSA